MLVINSIAAVCNFFNSLSVCHFFNGCRLYYASQPQFTISFTAGYCNFFRRYTVSLLSQVHCAVSFIAVFCHCSYNLEFFFLFFHSLRFLYFLQQKNFEHSHSNRKEMFSVTYHCVPTSVSQACKSPSPLSRVAQHRYGHSVAFTYHSGQRFPHLSFYADIRVSRPLLRCCHAIM